VPKEVEKESFGSNALSKIQSNDQHGIAKVVILAFHKEKTSQRNHK